MRNMSVAFLVSLTGMIAMAGAMSPGADKAQDKDDGWNRQGQELPWSEENYGVDVRTTATASRFITGKGVMARAEIEKRLNKSAGSQGLPASGYSMGEPSSKTSSITMSEKPTPMAPAESA